MKTTMIAAAACVAAAVTGALAPAAAASPGPRAARPATASRGPRAAETTGPGGATSWPAAAAGRGRRLRTVLLINGARVMAGPGTVDRGPMVVLPGGAAGQFVGLSVGGQSYLLPPGAAPYLGRGLAPSLFDVAALASHERAGRFRSPWPTVAVCPGCPG